MRSLRCFIEGNFSCLRKAPEVSLELDVFCLGKAGLRYLPEEPAEEDLSTLCL